MDKKINIQKIDKIVKSMDKHVYQVLYLENRTPSQMFSDL